MLERCKATNVNGSPCGAQAQRDGLCRWHDPVRAAEMTEARRKGGEAKSNANRAKKAMVSGTLTPAELEGLLGITMNAVFNGKKEPAVANAIANLARAAIAVREAADIEGREPALEAVAGERRTG